MQEYLLGLYLRIYCLLLLVNELAVSCFVAGRCMVIAHLLLLPRFGAALGVRNAAALGARNAAAHGACD